MDKPMNRIKEVLEEKGIKTKPGWQKNLEKVSVLSILMFAIEDSPVWKFYSDSRSPSNGRKRSYKIL